MTILAVLVVVLVMLPLLGWAGLKVKARPFPDYAGQTPVFETVPLPDDLPVPVERFYRTIIGDEIPVIETAVLTGRAPLRMNGLNMQGRFRFIHEAGQNYRHYIEVTLFGQGILRVNERYLDGQMRMELPGEVIENEAETNAAANQGLWGESLWLPTIFITDERVRWEAIDDTTARLIVPFGDDAQEFTMYFDPDNGLLTEMDTLRYREVGGELVGWRLSVQDWQTFYGITIPTVGAVTWADEDDPWAVFHIEDVAYNVDVSDYVRARGL